MTIQIPADLEERINLRLLSESGATVDDILRKALDSLDSHEEEVIAFQQGLDDLENGRVVPLDQHRNCWNQALSALDELKKLSPIDSGGQRFSREQLHERG